MILRTFSDIFGHFGYWAGRDFLISLPFPPIFSHFEAMGEFSFDAIGGFFALLRMTGGVLRVTGCLLKMIAGRNDGRRG